MFDLGSASSRLATAALASVACVHLPLCVFWFRLLFCRIGDGVSALVSFQSLCIGSVLLRDCPLCLSSLTSDLTQSVVPISLPASVDALSFLCGFKNKSLVFGLRLLSCLVCLCCY